MTTTIAERRRAGIITRQQRALLREHPEVRRPVEYPNFQSTAPDGRVLVALDAGEMQALRDYWDLMSQHAAQARHLFGRRHG